MDEGSNSLILFFGGICKNTKEAIGGWPFFCAICNLLSKKCVVLQT